MNLLSLPRARRALSAWSLGALVLALHAPVLAGPGAHGPNGEHLDGPATPRVALALPRIETHSELFELVAELRAGELAVVIDRYETNEPVLGAKLEVESAALKAVATFRAEQGDYVVTDAALLGALAAPGEHGVVFTLLAGADSDLLDGTLVHDVGGAPAVMAAGDHGHAHGDEDPGHAHAGDLARAAWTGALVAALGLIGGIAWWRQRRREAGAAKGGL